MPVLLSWRFHSSICWHSSLPLLTILSVLVWFFSLWVLELMVILVTSSSSWKTEFTRIFHDVFDVGGYAGSSQLEVSLLYLLAYLPCLFLLYYWFLVGSSLCEFWSLRSSWWQTRVLELTVILVTSSSSSKTEFTRIFYDVFDVAVYASSS